MPFWPWHKSRSRLKVKGLRRGGVCVLWMLLVCLWFLLLGDYPHEIKTLLRQKGTRIGKSSPLDLAYFSNQEQHDNRGTLVFFKHRNGNCSRPILLLALKNEAHISVARQCTQRPQLIGPRMRLNKTKLPPWGFESRPQPAVWINSFVREI